ncbi:MAG: type II secretion system F family protein [Thermosphaera sp.]
MKFWDRVYRYFGDYADEILRVTPSLSRNLRRSNIHIHTEVYASLVLFVLAVSAGIAVAIGVLGFFIGFPFIIPLVVVIPVLAYLLMLVIPSLIAGSRATAIDGEFPYTISYLSIMVMSGLSPYIAFERVLKGSVIFQKTSELAQRFVLLNKILGKDPLTAFAMLSDRNPSSRVRETLSGYISTVKAGGDVIDYLNKRARALFNDLLVAMKIIADRLGGLLESYLAIVLLTMISFTVLYFVTASYSGVIAFGIDTGTMALLLYILMPFISVAIIYLGDVMQYKEPWMDWRPYYMFFGVTIPMATVLSLLGIVLYGNPSYRTNPLVSVVHDLLVLPMSFSDIPPNLTFVESSIALSMALILSLIPSMIYAEYVAKEYTIINGITRFIRDLVEVRKTGLPPEKSIIELSSRDYGVFSKYLKKIALELMLGVPLRKIIDELFKKIKPWRAKVLLFILTDSIEVGGGTVDVLENLAWFAESIEAIEAEKKRSMRTLMIVPYLGAVLTAFTIVFMATYMGRIPLASGQFRAAASTVLPSIVLNTYLMGLVAGKVGSGSVAAGFKHALILTIVTMLFFMFAKVFTGFL